MIDLSQLTEDQINELELQIQKHKEQTKFRGYKVTLFVRFMPEEHKNDMLTSDGELDEGLFTDYLFDEVAPKIISDFNFNGFGEDVTIRSVKVATRQELNDVWGEN
jgi:hypothetical protein